MAESTTTFPRRPAGSVSREELLVAAAECIAERGFDGTRLRDVADKAGASIGSIQHYFVTRDRLLMQAFGWICDELIERWHAHAVARPSTPWERIELLLSELTRDPDLRRHCVTWTEFCASSARHPELRDAVAGVFEAWRGMIATIIDEGVTSGDFQPELSIADVVDIFNAAVDGFEMATAVDAGLVSARRFRKLMLGVASSLLKPAGAHQPT